MRSRPCAPPWPIIRNLHIIVPDGGPRRIASHWVSRRRNYFLTVPVLSRLFRHLLLKILIEAYDADRLKFFGGYASLADTAFLTPLRRFEWVVKCQRAIRWALGRLALHSPPYASRSPFPPTAHSLPPTSGASPHAGSALNLILPFHHQLLASRRCLAFQKRSRSCFS